MKFEFINKTPYPIREIEIKNNFFIFLHSGPVLYIFLFSVYQNFNKRFLFSTFYLELTICNLKLLTLYICIYIHFRIYILLITRPN